MIDKLEKTFDKTPSRDTLTDKMNEIIDYINKLESNCTWNGFSNLFNNNVEHCGNCNNTDGLCYTSNPPMVRCTITNEFHFYDDACNCIDKKER